MTATLTFHGATETVTGSKFLLTMRRRRLLVDCGLFQGPKELRLRNWEPLPFDPAAIDAVLLTHAHIDHSGYLPRLVRSGFTGPVHCTPPTADLVRILLPDAAQLLEEDAAYANRIGFSKHQPALPLYTKADARLALRRLKPASYGKALDLGPGVELRFLDAGHILGSSILQFDLGLGHDLRRRLVFSGDLGRYDEPITFDPARVGYADYVVLESTYGDRMHPDTDPADALADIVNRTVARGGTVLVPAFAVGRTQHLLFLLQQLENEGRIPVLPVFVDSPMARRATHVYEAHARDGRVRGERGQPHRGPFTTRRFAFTESIAASRALARLKEPAIILSASGMATGGRVLHHLARLLPRAENAVVFAGFQAAGTRGRRLVSGEPEVKIHGQFVPVGAEVCQLEGLSAHADQEELMRWLKGLRHAPRRVFLVHGEPQASAALEQRIRQQLGWPVEIARYGQVVELD
ncbi:MAG: MBL fold metallo-hydrolase [Chloroflexota bacterium]